MSWNPNSAGPTAAARTTPARPGIAARSALPADLLTLARAQHDAVTAAQALQFLSEGGLTRAVRAGRLVRLWKGALALPEHADAVVTRLAAADLTLGRTAIASHHTAAQLHGFGVESDGRTHVLASAEWGSRLGGLMLHRNLQTVPPVMVDDRPCTDATETALTVAAWQRSGQRTLGVLDAALRSAAVTREQLRQQSLWMSLNGIRRVRPLIEFADPRAESPPESWLRWVFLDAGLPPPTPQIKLWVGSNDYRIDLGWPEYRVGCEYDSREFHSAASLPGDRQRINALASINWLLTHATAGMVWTGRDRLVRATEVLLRSRGWRG